MKSSCSTRRNARERSRKSTGSDFPQGHSHPHGDQPDHHAADHINCTSKPLTVTKQSIAFPLERGKRREAAGEAHGDEQPQVVGAEPLRAPAKLGSRVMNQPRNRLPAILMISVPKGNAVPKSHPVRLPDPHRKTPPHAEPKATKMICVNNRTATGLLDRRSRSRNSPRIKKPRPAEQTPRRGRQAPTAAVDPR